MLEARDSIDGILRGYVWLQCEEGIHASREADHPFRIIAGKGEVLKVMQFLGDTLDYSNFKNTVARTPDQRNKHDAYATVQHTMIDALGGYGRPPKRRE